MNWNRFAKAMAAVLALAGASANARAATFVNGQGVTINTTPLGKLTSAEQVRVGSGLYRVEFRDALPSSLAFTDAVSAQSAAQALLDTVLRNFLVYLPDTVPGLTNGCGALVTSCTVYIPYQVSGSNLMAAYAINSAPLFGTDSAGISATTTAVSASNTATFATFTLTGAVPEPSTWLLMIAGFGVVGFALRRGRDAEWQPRFT